MVNPWEAGMGPRDAGSSSNYGSHMPSSASVSVSSGGGTSDLIDSLNQLSYMGNDRSKLALNILNAVLSSDSSVSESRDGWDNGPPARKIRRVDWAGMRPPPVRKYPQRDRHYSPRRTWDRRGRGGHAYGPSEHHAGNEYQFRKMAKARRGKPWHDTRNSKGPAKDQKVKDEAETSDNPERDTTDADETAHAADPSQSDTSKEAGKETGKESKEAGKETEEDTSQGAEGEEEEKSEEKKDKEKQSDEITWLPREALRCHICSLSKFPDIKAYLRHLQSRKHENIKYSFHAKGAAILHFLRAESKLASQRQMLKNQRRGIKGPIMHCRKCQCEVFGYTREHAKTVEHIALKNFLRVQCCNNTYFNRADLEEHRLSLIHLKNQLELEQKLKKEEEENAEDIGVEENERGKLFGEIIEQMKKRNPLADVTSPESLTPYDPALPHGLNFISKKSYYRCKVCPEVRLITAKETEEHFKSLDHYDNLMTHLNAVEEEKEKKRLEEKAKKEELKKKQEEEAAKKREEESDAAKKNGEQDDGEEISFEDMHNMETVDEASEDVDMDTSAEASNGAAKDEQMHSDEEEDDEDEGVEDDEEEVEEEEEDADKLEKCDESVHLDEVGESIAENEEDPDFKKRLVNTISDVVKEDDEGMKDEVSASSVAAAEELNKPSDEDNMEVNERESVTEESDAPNNSEEKVKSSTSATPRGKRGRGRGRGRNSRN